MELSLNMSARVHNWAFVALALQMTGYVYDGSSDIQGNLCLNQASINQFCDLPEEVSLRMLRYLDDKKPLGATNRRNRGLVRQLELGLCCFVLTLYLVLKHLFYVGNALD